MKQVEAIVISKDKSYNEVNYKFYLGEVGAIQMNFVDNELESVDFFQNNYIVARNVELQSLEYLKAVCYGIKEFFKIIERNKKLFNSYTL